MAKKTLIVDDLTGEAGARTRRFALDGVDYEIDLTDGSYAELKGALKAYLRAARPVRGETPATRRAAKPRAAGKSRASTSDAAAVRAWARQQGLPVTERGRVTAELRSAWQAAGSPR